MGEIKIKTTSLLLLFLNFSVFCEANAGNWVITGTAGNDAGGFSERLVIGFVNQQEVSRGTTKFSPSGSATFRILMPSSLVQGGSQVSDLGNLIPGKVYDYQGTPRYPEFQIRVISDEDSRLYPSLWDGSLAIIDSSRNLGISARDSIALEGGGDITKIIVKILVSVVTFSISLAFLLHFIPTILPQDKTSELSKRITLISASGASLIVAISSFTSSSGDKLAHLISERMADSVMAAFTILFISLSGFLFWRKIVALFK